MSMPSQHPRAAEIDRVARLLMNAWAKAEPSHGVTLHPTSYIATFVDMARAIVEDRYGRDDESVTASVWYMHDNHTFTRLRGTVDDIVTQARELGVKSPYGMLGPLRLLAPNGQILETVGKSIHARAGGFDEPELIEWRSAVVSSLGATGALEKALAGDDQ